jgi:hypothetical protein
MKKILPALLLLCCPSAFAQRNFDIREASRFFDIKVVVANCEDGACKGRASYSFYKKGARTPYQIINLPDTYFDLDASGKPRVNDTLLYDKQSAVNVGDYNFDDMEDIAICNSTNGSYGMPSYFVYLSSKAAGKFVYDRSFSALGQHLGMFQVDATKKVLRTYDKSGCCSHVTEEFSVVNNRPRKVTELTEDATIADETKMKVTTRTLVNGRWRIQVKYVKRPE